MPNLYGDILSDAGAEIYRRAGARAERMLRRGLCIRSVHGTAPDIKGLRIINPTATMLSAAMMLDYLGFGERAERLRPAIYKVYAEGTTLTRDQGGIASPDDFAGAVASRL